MLRNIRVLVVDDSALIRQLVTRALEQDPRIEIVGTARDGVQAVEKARSLEPDVVTLDIEMPELTGLEALPYIVKSTNARVIMLSSLDDPETTYQALSLGAVDFISKPRGGFASSIGELSEMLIKKVKTAHRIDPSKRIQSGESIRSEGDVAVAAPPATTLRKVVLIAASTGGPPALEKVFSGLHRDLPAAFLVVQHLPSGFTTSFTRRLDRVTDLEVVEGRDGLRVEPGKAYVAPHGVHMRLDSAAGSFLHLRLDDAPAMHGVKPAADPLFLSAAQKVADRTVGVVLTGMGSDGAEGLRELQLNGGETIAQDEESSVVWGMPGAAVRRGAVRHVVPLDLVAAEIRRAVRS